MSSRRILVVEDEPLINQAVSDRLVTEGYDVVRAYDGPGAVASFEEHQPDLTQRPEQPPAPNEVAVLDVHDGSCNCLGLVPS